MYAVFATGGKQYRVKAGEFLKVEKIEHETGSEVVFNQIMMISNGEESQIGAPYLADSVTVTAEVVRHGRAKKVKIIKMRRRKHHMKHQGHRQWFTEVRITAINAA